MNIFSKYANELPPFKDYLQIMLNNSRMIVKNNNTVMRVAHLDMAKRGLFNTKKNTNIERTARMHDIVSVGILQMKKEVIDTRKATWRNLSKSVYRRSWEHSTKEDKIITCGCHATNDQSENTLGGTTRALN